LLPQYAIVARRPANLRYRPRLEVLEDRWLLSTLFAINPPGAPLLGPAVIGNPLADQALLSDVHQPRLNATATLSPSANPVVVGQGVTFTITVSGQGQSSFVPTGKVLLLEDREVVDTAYLNGGTAQILEGSLAFGAHTLLARYSGDAHFLPTDSAALSEVVNQAETVTRLNSSETPTIFGQPIQLTAQVSAVLPGGGSPDGMVGFYNGTSLLGTAGLSKGIAVFESWSPEAGLYPITAKYLGSASYHGSASSVLNEEVKPVPTFISIPFLNPTVFGQLAEFTATVTTKATGIGIPGGMVRFLDGDTVIGEAPLNGGTASLPVFALATGTHPIIAVYEGSRNFAASISKSATDRVAAADTTITLGVPPGFLLSGPPTFGQAVVFSVTVSPRYPGAGTPTGMVQFFNNGTLLGTATLTDGSATFQTFALPAGMQGITASYLGDGNFNGSSTAAELAVQPAPTTTTLRLSTEVTTLGQGVDFRVTVNTLVAGAGFPTGTVTFEDVTGPLVTLRLVDGVAVFHTAALGPGVHYITAVYHPDPNFAGSASETMKFVVRNPVPEVTALDVTSALEGGGGFSLVVTGANFVPSSVVLANGAALETVFVSDTELIASVPASVLAEEGPVAVNVFTLSIEGGGNSNPLVINVGDATLSGQGLTVPTAGGTFNGLIARFSDANPNADVSDFTATITWGDGGSSTGTIIRDARGGFDVVGSHVFAATTNYAVSVTIRDDGGSMATANSTIVILTAAQLQALESYVLAISQDGNPLTSADLTNLEVDLIETPVPGQHAILFAGVYSGNPQGVSSNGVRFYDVRVTGAGADARVILTFHIPPNSFQVGLSVYDPLTGSFRLVQGSTRFADSMTIDLAHGIIQLIVDGTSFPTLGSLSGTVFTVSFSATDTSTVSVAPALALGSTGTRATTDVSAANAFTRTPTLVNTTQLVVALSPSQDTHVTTAEAQVNGGMDNEQARPDEGEGIGLWPILLKAFDLYQDWQNRGAPPKPEGAPAQPKAPDMELRVQGDAGLVIDPGPSAPVADWRIALDEGFAEVARSQADRTGFGAVPMPSPVRMHGVQQIQVDAAADSRTRPLAGTSATNGWRGVRAILGLAAGVLGAAYFAAFVARMEKPARRSRWIDFGPNQARSPSASQSNPAEKSKALR
jgi:hypothetical protein